jgi:LAO/AO transport system kinase
VVNKADGQLKQAAAATRAEYKSVMQLMRPRTPGWQPDAVLVSAHECTGIDKLWETALKFKKAAERGGGMQRGRAEQRLSWLWGAVGDMVVDSLRRDPQHAALAKAVEDGRVSPATAAAEIAGAALVVSPKSEAT